MSFYWFNEEAIKKAGAQKKQAPAGFVYGYIPDIIRPERYQELVEAFPNPKKFSLVDKQSGGGRKRFYVGPAYFSGRDRGCLCMFTRHSAWKKLFEEANSPELTNILSSTLGVPLNSVCDFGLAYGDAGCLQEPHIDGSARADDPNEVKSTIATIVYFNKNADPFGGTEVYLPDRTTVLAGAPNLKNGMFYFQQHNQAWHGFPQMPNGTDRRVLSLSWSNEKSIIPSKGFAHSLICKTYWKSLLTS